MVNNLEVLVKFIFKNHMLCRSFISKIEWCSSLSIVQFEAHFMRSEMFVVFEAF